MYRDSDFLVWTPPYFFGQADTGSIAGRVSDSSGASIAGVQITVIQKETNFSFSSVTNNEGLYRVQSLPPGTYNSPCRLRVSSRPFRGLILRVGDVLPVNARWRSAPLPNRFR